MLDMVMENPAALGLAVVGAFVGGFVAKVGGGGGALFTLFAAILSGVACFFLVVFMLNR